MTLHHRRLMNRARKVIWLLFGVTFSTLSPTAGARDAAPVAISGGMKGQVSITPWIERRKSGIVLQEHDFSCGAGALATLLSSYYGIPVTEGEILAAVGKQGWLSLADMQSLLPRYGLKGVGLALDYDQLTQLRMPVIVHIHNYVGPHFAVLRGISEKTIWVADPATGNNKFPRSKFREKWEIANGGSAHGKVLAVLPADPAMQPKHREFFLNRTLEAADAPTPP